MTSYLGVAGTERHQEDGIFHKNLAVRISDITDGTSNTLMIGERPAGPNGIYAGWYAWWGSSVCRSAQILPVGPNDWIPREGVGCRPEPISFRPGQIGNACDLNHYWSPHSTGANFAFADGSVRFLRYDADPIMPALATRAGGESVTNLD